MAMLHSQLACFTKPIKSGNLSLMFPAGSRKNLLLCLALWLPCAFLAQAEPVAKRIEVSRDLWLSAVGSEGEGNNGASPS